MSIKSRFSLQKTTGRTTLQISIDIHDALKVFAASKGLTMKDATAYLIKAALTVEYKGDSTLSLTPKLTLRLDQFLGVRSQ